MPVIKDFVLVKTEEVISRLQQIVAEYNSLFPIVLSASECVLLTEEEEGECMMRQSALRFDNEDNTRYVQVTYEMSEDELSAGFNKDNCDEFLPSVKSGKFTYWLCDISEMSDLGIPQVSNAAWKIKELNTHFCYHNNNSMQVALDTYAFLSEGTKPNMYKPKG